MQQLAVITPYAEFSFGFTEGDPAGSRSFVIQHARRSDSMPESAKEV